MNHQRIYLVDRNNSDKRACKIAHPWDGRLKPVSHTELFADAEKLAEQLDLEKADYIVGFAEGGLIPAFAVASVANKPMVGSYRVRCKLPNEIIFSEPHSERSAHYVYGLCPGDKVIIVEDEITTGDTLENAIRSFAEKNIEVVDIGTYLLPNNFPNANKEREQLLQRVKYLHRISVDPLLKSITCL